MNNISSKREEDMDNSSSDHNKTPFGSRLRRSCLSFAASVQEGFRYVKAFFVGQVKTITARNEQEASEAELEATKKQVDATDAAQDIKNRLKISQS
ncbi:hypothetical protein VIGAN_03147600 [Vigna angularis var. angularis]|uniref:Uncharacterized protein n=2 Tax=Phaseolus angularis TaxID=3914 RepID=A0A0S3RM61_PHAAN|nr:uncharacterized protein LOC108336426 [Vigna angularis]BAT81686.1 hypothetical protein VIGAN_03147600 [Vigna angularis var. angularis]